MKLSYSQLVFSCSKLTIKTLVKGWPFSSVINFACKDGQVTAAICKFCPLVVSPLDEALWKFLLLPIVAKSSILNVPKFLDPPLKTSPCMKTSPVSCETNLFSYYFKMWPPLLKVIIFLYFNFYGMMKYF